MLDVLDRTEEGVAIAGCQDVNRVRSPSPRPHAHNRQRTRKTHNLILPDPPPPLSTTQFTDISQHSDLNTVSTGATWYTDTWHHCRIELGTRPSLMCTGHGYPLNFPTSYLLKMTFTSLCELCLSPLTLFPGTLVQIAPRVFRAKGTPPGYAG